MPNNEKQLFEEWVVKPTTNEEKEFAKNYEDSHYAIGFYAGYKVAEQQIKIFLDYLCGQEDYIIIRSQKVTRNKLLGIFLREKEND